MGLTLTRPASTDAETVAAAREKYRGADADRHIDAAFPVAADRLIDSVLDAPRLSLALSHLDEAYAEAERVEWDERNEPDRFE